MDILSAGRFVRRMFCPHRRFVATDVLSPRTFCPHGLFVPTMFCPRMFCLRTFCLRTFCLGTRVTPDGSSWWSASDPVHLSQGSYRVLASTVTSVQSSDEDGASMVGRCGSSATEAGSSTHSSGKRKRVDSAVIAAPQRGGRGRFVSHLGWLRGCTDNTHEMRGVNMHRVWHPHWGGRKEPAKEPTRPLWPFWPLVKPRRH
jgi:hypothetical protein